MRRRLKIKELTNLQFALVLTLPVLVFLVTIIIYPLIYSIWISFHSIIFFGGFKTSFVGFSNYKDILHYQGFWHSLIISLRFTVESVILTMLIGLGIALALSRSFPGKKIIRSFVILPWAVSLYGSGIMFKYLWRGRTGLPTAISYLFGFNRSLDMLGERTVIEALAIGNSWNLAPLVAFFLLANIETIPARLYDMAEIDHMGPFRRFYYIVLPYLRFTLFVFTAISCVFSLKLFDFIFVQTGGGPGVASATLTYQIYKESFTNLKLGYGAAMSFYLLIVILAMTFTLYFLWGRREE
jgi:multiple sugar transport system permease protein